jgi:hypothetical protein
MRQSVRHLIKHIFAVIPDMNVKSQNDLRASPQSCKPRAPMEFVGSFLRSAFGNAKMSYIEELNKSLELVKKDVLVAAHDAIRVRDGLASFCETAERAHGKVPRSSR